MFTIKPLTKAAAWLIAAVIVVLNLKLFNESVGEWMSHTPHFWVKAIVVALVVFIYVMLIVTTVYPFIMRRKEANIFVHENVKDLAVVATEGAAKPFGRIALALDFGANDAKVMRYALQLAGSNDAQFTLIHVVESASARKMGQEAHDYETRQDQQHLNEYVSFFNERGYKAEGLLGFKDRAPEIARIIKEQQCDLLIIGSHGHNTAHDILYGETINTVRHMIKIPVFIAQ